MPKQTWLGGYHVKLIVNVSSPLLSFLLCDLVFCGHIGMDSMNYTFRKLKKIPVMHSFNLVVQGELKKLGDRPQ